MKIKMQRGSRCSQDQDATRVKMHFLNLSQFVQLFSIFREMKNNEEKSFLSYQLNAEFAQFTMV